MHSSTSLMMPAKIRRDARVFRRQFRSVYFPAMGQCRAALVWIRLCPGVCFRVFRRALAIETRLLRFAAGTRERFHHLDGTLWSADRWSDWLRPVLQAGDVARTALDPSSVGRWYGQSWRYDWYSRA